MARENMEGFLSRELSSSDEESLVLKMPLSAPWSLEMLPRDESSHWSRDLLTWYGLLNSSRAALNLKRSNLLGSCCGKKYGLECLLQKQSDVSGDFCRRSSFSLFDCRQNNHGVPVLADHQFFCSWSGKSVEQNSKDGQQLLAPVRNTK